MNILMTEGFDMYNGSGTNTGLQALWTNISTSGTFFGTNGGRFGGQSMALQNGAIGSQTAAAYRIFNPSGNTTTMSFGFAFMTTNLITGRCLEIANLSVGSQCGVGTTATGQVRFYSGAGGTVLATSAAGLLVTSTWAYIEVELTLNASTGSFAVYVNGVLACSGTGNTFAAGGAGGGLILGVRENVNLNVPNNFDDIYITDTATRLGESKIETLRATGDSSVQWTPNSGSNNFSRINETLVDGDTSYNQTATLGARDLYTNGGLSTTPANIWSVTVVGFEEKTDATTRAILHSVQSNGTDSDGTAFNQAANYGRYDRIIQNDPHTSAAWTASGVNNLLFGPKAA